MAVELSLSGYRQLSDQEDERLLQEAYEQVFGPFGRGDFREITDQDWQALIAGQRKFLNDSQSLALPPKGQDG